MGKIHRALAVLGLVLSLTVLSVQPVPAAPVNVGSGAAFGLTAAIAGTEAIPPTPAVETTHADADASETLVGIPGDPLAVSGTLNTSSAVHTASDLDSALTVVEQGVAGPYNARSVASVEELSVLLDSVEEGVALIENVDLRTEAVAVCNDDGTVEYSANTEIIDLRIGGEMIPLNQPIQDLLDQLSEALAPLGDLISFDTNVITETEDGIMVDALVLNVGQVLEGGVEVRIGHAEVGGVQCAPPLPSPSEPEAPAAPEPPDEPDQLRGPLPSTGGSNSALMGLGAAGLLVAGLALRRRLATT